MKNTKKKIKISIRTKILIGMIVCVLIICNLIGWVFMAQAQATLLGQCKLHAKSVVSVAASKIDGDVLSKIQPGDEKTDNYLSILEEMQDFLAGDDIEYIYTMRKSNGELQFVVDADTEEGAAIGEAYETYEEIEEAFQGDVTVDSEITSDEWGSFYSAFAPIYNSSEQIVGIVGVDCSAKAIKQQSSTFIKEFLIIEVVGLLIGIVLALFISRVLAKNISTISNKVKELAEKEGDLTQQIKVTSVDEVGDIADSLNVFLVNLREIICEMSESEKTLLGNSECINDTVAVSATEVNQMSGAMNDMEQKVTKMTSIVNEIDQTAIKNSTMTLSVMEETKKQADYVQEISRKASDLEKNSVDAMNQIKSIIEQTGETVRAKIEDAKQVEQVQQLTDKIMEIASQTNLLSLNASIEAARSGEHGKGFAVVATEIGALSEESTKTAGEISDINNFIIKLVDDLSKASFELLSIVDTRVMSDYEVLVSTSKEYMKDAQMFRDQMLRFFECMKELQLSMEQIMEYVKQITSEFEKQKIAVGENVERIEVVHSKFQEISNAVADNKEIVNKLDCIIGQFKI